MPRLAEVVLYGGTAAFVIANIGLLATHHYDEAWTAGENISVAVGNKLTGSHNRLVESKTATKKNSSTKTGTTDSTSTSGEDAGSADDGSGKASSDTKIDHVLMIWEENEDAKKITAKNAPYLTSLGKKFGHSEDSFYAETHPSEPNYAAFLLGKASHIHDDGPPSKNHFSDDNILRHLGQNYTVLAEGMPSNCYQGARAGNFAVKHVLDNYRSDPSDHQDCLARSQPYSDVASADFSKKLTILIPNLINDGHNGSHKVEHIDAFLKKTLGNPDGSEPGTFFASKQYKSGRYMVDVTFDESEKKKKSDPNIIQNVAVSPRTDGVVSTTPYNHYTLTAAACILTGAKGPILGDEKSGRAFIKEFNLA